MLNINFENEIIEFDVQYRKRKTLAIKVTPPNNIKVISPIGINEDRIKEVVKSKGKWIIKKLDELKKIDYSNFKREFEDGDAFMYLGNNYILQIVVTSNLKVPFIELSEDKIYIYSPINDKDVIKKAMEVWYREKCYERIKDRVKYYKYIIGKEPKNFKVKEQKKRWGSCTSRGDIYFNWRIIMAPAHVIDYIVVHEMCHLIHLNHSKEFWNLVKTIIPNYEDAKRWLKQNGLRMNLE